MNSNMCDNGIFSPKFFVAVCTIVRFRSKLDPLEQKYKHLKFESNFENATNMNENLCRIYFII